ncbi:MAG: ATP-binding protein [Pseudonocardiaceae bacterium]
MAASLVREVAPAAAVVMPVTVEDQPSSCGFVRRDQELAALLALLDPRRTAAPAGIVVSGMAGVGKSALAWQAARTAVERGWFPGGAVIVDPCLISTRCPGRCCWWWTTPTTPTR